MCLDVTQLTARPVAAGNCPTSSGCGTSYDPVVCKGGCPHEIEKAARAS